MFRILIILAFIGVALQCSVKTYSLLTSDLEGYYIATVFFSKKSVSSKCQKEGCCSDLQVEEQQEETPSSDQMEKKDDIQCCNFFKDFRLRMVELTKLTTLYVKEAQDESLKGIFRPPKFNLVN